FHESIYFVGCANGEVHALDSQSGKTLWQVPTGQAVAHITLGDKVIYVAGSNGQISVFDAKTGAVGWVDQLYGAIDTSPVLFGNLIYYATGLNNLYSYKIR